jgi:hypothetical protein
MNTFVPILRRSFFMVQRILQTALSLLLICGILSSIARPAQLQGDSEELQYQSSLALAHAATAILSDDDSDDQNPIPISLAFGIESDVEEESDSKKRNLSQQGLFKSGEQVVHHINAPPCPNHSKFVARAHGLPLFLLFEVFRL